MTPRQLTLKNRLMRETAMTQAYQQIYKDDRELWEGLLKANFGQTSRKDLTITELQSLLSFLTKGEFIKPKFKPKPREVNPKATAKQIYKIEKLWQTKARDTSYPALANFINRVVKNRPFNLEVLSKQEATSVIVALEKMGGGKNEN